MFWVFSSVHEGDSLVEWFKAQDLKSGGPWLEFSTLLLFGFALGCPEFSSIIINKVQVQVQVQSSLDRVV